MALNLPVAEELITLLEDHPDLTVVQKAILKSAAAYLVQDENDRLHLNIEFSDYDRRLKLIADEYDIIPNRIELWAGIPRPKEWSTPNRIAASARAMAEFKVIVAEGFSMTDAWNEWSRRKKAGQL